MGIKIKRWIFSIGIFSLGIFNIGLYTIGFFLIGWKKNYGHWLEGRANIK
jgi:hypothetical protein